LRTAAVWADCAKGVKMSGGTLKYTAKGTYPECAIYENDASIKAMVAFVKRNWSACNPAPDEDPCHKQYHYTDIAIQRTAYTKNVVGTSDHDIVSAISASVAVIKGNQAPTPFSIASKREAIRILSHYVGDIHQPLHVVSVYLNADGQIIDPDVPPFDPHSKNRGGNDLLVGSMTLHSVWDGILISMSADHLTPAMVAAAKAVPITVGAVEDWSTVWATDTLIVGKAAFTGLSYGHVANKKWKVTLPPGYDTTHRDLQREQLLNAGARLAQILQATLN